MNQEELKIPSGGYSTPENYSGMSLVWRDEFEGDNLNPSDWKHETGGSGWGNNELEYYQEKNTTVHDGYLIITAETRKCWWKELYFISNHNAREKKNFNTAALTSVLFCLRVREFGQHYGCLGS